jgi:predicted  nucleic acid-binding Zn-ribbon protein
MHHDWHCLPYYRARVAELEREAETARRKFDDAWDSYQNALQVINKERERVAELQQNWHEEVQDHMREKERADSLAERVAELEAHIAREHEEYAALEKRLYAEEAEHNVRVAELEAVLDDVCRQKNQLACALAAETGMDANEALAVRAMLKGVK